MRLTTPDNIVYSCQKVARPPKMNNKNGKTWDVYARVAIDGTTTKLMLDTTWGEFFYFYVQGQCYKIRMQWSYKQKQYYQNVLDFVDQVDNEVRFCTIF